MVPVFDEQRADRAQAKKCPKCKTIKPVTAFTKNKSNKDGLSWSCRECNKAYLATWHESNPGYDRKRWNEKKDYYRDRNVTAVLKRMYGLSRDEYEKMLAEQGGVCSICGEVCNSGKRLSVDHDHVTGKVRALLCGNCNKGLGNFQDNPSLLRIAAEYLERFKGGDANERESD